jgi:hypothetical protein
MDKQVTYEDWRILAEREVKSTSDALTWHSRVRRG